MKYCEECKLLVVEESCPECGSEHLREPNDEDFCFLVECRQEFGDILKNALADEGVESVLVPWGNGVRTALGMELENFRVYVPFKNVEVAVEILKEFIGEPPMEKLRKKLLENADEWHMKESAAKKIRKKLKLGKDDDIFAAIEEGIKNSDSIQDRGLMGTFYPPAHGIMVRIDDVVLWFSDETFEIQI